MNNSLGQRFARPALRAAACLLAIGVAAPLSAEPIPVNTPRLAARGEGGAPAPAAAPASPYAAAPSTPSQYPASPASASQYPAASPSPSASQYPAASQYPSTPAAASQYPSATQYPSASQYPASQYPSSTPYAGAAQPAGGYSAPAAQYGGYGAQSAQPGSYGATGAPPSALASAGARGAAYGAASAGPVATIMPQRAELGVCRAQPSPDRQTLMLVTGADSLARAQVPLGEYRAQQVVHSPDGHWAVAYTKLRGREQFAAMTIDLDACKVQNTIELPTAGQDVRFEGDQAVLQLSGGERRVGLRDGRVR